MDTDNNPPLKKYKKIPVFIVEDHNEVLPFIYRAIGSKHLPVYDNIIIHFDSHPDMGVPMNLKAETASDKYKLYDSLSIENWILPASFAGHLTKLVWIKPPWSKQMEVGVKNFTIGRQIETGLVKLNSMDPYFMSDGLYCPESKMDSKREVTLFVSTLGDCEDSNEAENSNPDAVINNLATTFTDLKDYILDIDLDFFSTMNPFRRIYEKCNLYERLKDLYFFQTPDHVSESSLHQCAERRSQQLTELDALFSHLEEHRTLGNWPKERTHLFREVAEIERLVKAHYPDRDIEWLSIHDAGCTTDYNDCLPHHIAYDEEITSAVDDFFGEFISRLPRPPTIITISRSSDDDYCPSDQVQNIQDLVMEKLKSCFDIDQPTLQYLLK